MASWFDRHVITRGRDYAWAFRVRFGSSRRRTDALTLSEGRRRPVMLLPGVYESWHFLEAAATHLNALGYPVFAVPTLGRNARPVAETAKLARACLVDNDLRNVVIVAHSKGGLVGKALMGSPEGMARVRSMVAINAPFAGSDYAHLTPLRALREFEPTGESVVSLARDVRVNARITSIFSEWDPVVPNGSELAGATNIRLPVAGHFRILDQPDLLDRVTRVVREP